MKTITDTQRVYVVSITDTRMFGDDHKPISGTGDTIECEHCGRKIEVHAEVVIFDTQTKTEISSHIIGTECCKKLNAGYYNENIAVSNKDYWKRPNFLLTPKSKKISEGMVFRNDNKY